MSMVNPPEPQEMPSEAERASLEGFERARKQSEHITEMMGGPLPEQPHPERLDSILDVGCGAGDWLVHIARTHPHITTLVGIDTSSKLLSHARALVRTYQLEQRVAFQTMDALSKLAFPTQTFSLVNMRFGSAFLRKWEWPQLLHELIRVARPEGIIRITEGLVANESTSQALRKLGSLFLKATQQAGYTFSDTSNGVTDSDIIDLCTRHGLQNIQSRSYTLEYRFGTPEWQAYYDDTRRSFRSFRPLLRKWTSIPADYEELCQQALAEIEQPDFAGIWELRTIWGTTPAF